MTEVEPEEIHGVLDPVERDLARHGGHTEQTEVECHLTPGSYIVYFTSFMRNLIVFYTILLLLKLIISISKGLV